VGSPQSAERQADAGAAAFFSVEDEDEDFDSLLEDDEELLLDSLDELELLDESLDELLSDELDPPRESVR
jgi:hypothetical protein